MGMNDDSIGRARGNKIPNRLFKMRGHGGVGHEGGGLFLIVDCADDLCFS